MHISFYGGVFLFVCDEEEEEEEEEEAKHIFVLADIELTKKKTTRMSSSRVSKFFADSIFYHDL